MGLKAGERRKMITIIPNMAFETAGSNGITFLGTGYGQGKHKDENGQWL